MGPVIGIDVSKGKSEVQAFLGKNKPFGKSFSIEHTKTGLEELHAILQEVEKQAGERPKVIFEATGHYHLPLAGFLDERGYTMIIVNPLTSQRAKKSHLRKVKTDAADAWHLGELYYKEEFSPYVKRSIVLLELRHLSRQQEALTSMYVQIKLTFHATLDQVFPHYPGTFTNLFSTTSLRLLYELPTPERVMQTGVDEIAERILSLNARSKSANWAYEKAKKMMDAAQASPSSTAYESHQFTLQMMIVLLLQHQEHLQRLETKIDALAQSITEYDLLRSIPGIGDKLAATILSELGDIDQFDHAKKLVAFAGIDPSVFSSGKFTATANKITKRGSKRLRKALYLAVQCGLRRATNQRLSEFYTKKRLEGKPYRVAIIACANKLLHIIFALLKSGETYRIA